MNWFPQRLLSLFQSIKRTFSSSFYHEGKNVIAVNNSLVLNNWSGHTGQVSTLSFNLGQWHQKVWFGKTYVRFPALWQIFKSIKEWSYSLHVTRHIFLVFSWTCWMGRRNWMVGHDSSIPDSHRAGDYVDMLALISPHLPVSQCDESGRSDKERSVSEWHPSARCHTRSRSFGRTIQRRIQTDPRTGNPHRQAAAHVKSLGRWKEEDRHVRT